MTRKHVTRVCEECKDNDAISTDALEIRLDRMPASSQNGVATRE
jgi:hypothetical protein